MIWVCLKSGIATKLQVSICRPIRWFALVKLHIHVGSALLGSVCKRKA